ncbi:eukaryotic translation elongation factor 1 delta a (guanine nucleotide exchange protein) isoform X1 [Pygocentrus nattereri]|uniref:Translation elongation factor EF1B beta/delta subunit guanine nucleotide exchange domain-containing protein n=2 Tax=Pygocentrus nattereri TaxID=42514 RepID=A0A3B4DNJ9_PYGNA|nr:eukaryotic translation elongation factor 1 delta a (guanine nucleotide exchange protein) isoform X1 [Pygocentrus nattereri]
MENQRVDQSWARGTGRPRQGSGNSPSLPSANVNGNDPHGARRRQNRSSYSESQGLEGNVTEGFGPMQGTRGEIVWFNSSMYEEAEGYFQNFGSGTRAPPLSSSPRDRVHRPLVFRAKRNPSQQSRDEGSPRPHSHHRSSSEPQRGRMAPRGAGRKRVFSETERTPQKGRDKTKMSDLQCLGQEKIWFDKSRYDEAERRFYEGINGISQAPQERDASAILQDIVKARQKIQQSLDGVKAALQTGKGHSRPQKTRERKTSQNASKTDQSELLSRLKNLELDNKNLRKVVDDLRAMLSKLESRMSVLEKSQSQPTKPASALQAAPAPNPKVVVKDEEGDDDIDLFGSDKEDEEAERIKAQRVQEYAARKSAKPALIAKSSILLDVKPWDDETDMAKLEECVRSVQADGLLWGASKLVPVGYGIKKLQINCVVEDDKVGTDMLEEEITKFEDYVQSVDVAAFNKI